MFIQNKYSVVTYLRDNGNYSRSNATIQSELTALVRVTQIHTLPLLPEKSRES